MNTKETALPKHEEVLSIEQISRPEAIDRLRERLKNFVVGEHCLCEVAGRLGIFCRGFRRLSDAEFRQRFDWLLRRHPGSPRKALEELASLYHEGRQEATGAEICCDIETREHVGCDGWNTFDNRQLEEFHLALVGRPVQIS